MKQMLKCGVVATLGMLLLAGCASMNDYQISGQLPVQGLKESITVDRDERGVAYIRASSLDDALVGHGFVSAQDRLFQMELLRRLVAGRISEFAGEKALEVDTRMRTLGLYRAAEKHAEILNPSSLAFFQSYTDGVNAYIQTRGETLPLEFKLAGITPEPWSVVDSLSILYMMAWNTSANIYTEVAMQALVEKIGMEKAQELFPLNVNPDLPEGILFSAQTGIQTPSFTGLNESLQGLAWLKPSQLNLGSNNWVTGPAKSTGSQPILANDPHLDSRILPGPWYPVGLFTPDLRTVGVSIAGIPGVTIGRTNHIAIGITNAYGDMQDLYIETVDPQNANNYLEGEASIPFEIREEIIRYKDKKAPDGVGAKTVQVRSTRRGPVVSGLLKHLETDKVLTLRFAPLETMHSKVGFDEFAKATSVDQALEALSHVNMISLNMVLADTQGNIAWRVTGKLPNRTDGGTVPYVVIDGRDNWDGWVPFEKMPHAVNPEKGWLGTCNHATITQETDYYHSSYFSPSYRYRRLKELMAPEEPMSVEDHWQFQRDAKNLFAARVAPLMARALASNDETKAMGAMLEQWNYHDDVDQSAPTVFQATFLKFAFNVFEDELGEETTKVYLDNWYIWQERLLDMVLKNDSPWFDDVRTTQVRETRDDMFVRAALDAKAELEESLGKNPEKWLWGKIHQFELVSPIRREGFGKGLVGGGSHPFPGSGDTLCRGWYDVNKPYGVTHSASLRMVVDLSDDEKVLAVMPGGVAARIFHPHAKDQISDFLSGNIRYWWFSEKAIDEHSQSRLVLAP